MEEEKIGTGIKISRSAYDHLNIMAEHDMRSPTTQEIEWLIEQVWASHPANRSPQPTPPTRRGTGPLSRRKES
jgi:hypothetical protein